jgi:hypothetical protein
MRKEGVMQKLESMWWVMGIVVLWGAVACATDVRSAMVHVEADGNVDFRGAVTRCEPDKPIGLWVNGSRAVTMTNLVIEGCEVGVFVSPGAPSEGYASDEAPRVRVRGMHIRRTTICFFLAGNGSIATDNISAGCDYGWVISGDENILQRNTSDDNTRDGYLITGDGNVLEDNQALRNGGVGIHVASMVPLVGDRKAIFAVQDQGLGNTIRENTALRNRLDIRDFTETCQELETNNQWSGNTFKTREPDCIE